MEINGIVWQKDSFGILPKKCENCGNKGNNPNYFALREGKVIGNCCKNRV